MHLLNSQIKSSFNKPFVCFVFCFTILLTGCARNVQPSVDFSSQTKLIEYQACIQTSIGNLRQLNSYLSLETLMSRALEECAIYKP